MLKLNYKNKEGKAYGSYYSLLNYRLDFKLKICITIKKEKEIIVMKLAICSLVISIITLIITATTFVLSLIK